MTFSLILATFAVYQFENGYLAFGAILLFESGWQMTMGPIHWSYLPEVLNDI
jgi:hypothetical protein